jgi:hypothetical protein
MNRDAPTPDLQAERKGNTMSGDFPISRREALRLAATAGIVLVAAPKWLDDAVVSEATGASNNRSVPTPELTGGPYWVNTRLHRSDVRSNTANATTAPGVVQQGVPLTLTINVLDAGRTSSVGTS